MFVRRVLIIKTVVFLLSAALSMDLYGGEDAVKKDSSPKSKLIEERIDRGLGMALEAISIAGNHTVVKDSKTNSFLNTEVTQKGGLYEENVNINSEDIIAEKPYKQSSEIHNPLITEPIKIQKKKHSKKTKSLIPEHFTIQIPANRPWAKTNIYLKENDIVKIYCKGKIMPGAFEYRYKNTSCLAEGYHFTRGNFTVLPNTRYLAAIGKIGNRDAFYIGSGREFVSYVDGPLYLGINELNKSIYTGEPINRKSVYWKDNTGYYEADVYVYRK
ncbi:MAG: hypothetical protein HON76_04795 [Candidatus Scalindua sp.]|nr:hypothetical protein [Candidatus Scalindua sp.]MBT6561828.1 hypothetical protein [Candidatus Scalindua sp.]